jgi:hypothetical protein
MVRPIDAHGKAPDRSSRRPLSDGLPLGYRKRDTLARDTARAGGHLAVSRRWGWDCHGLPVEHEVEKELNVKRVEVLLDPERHVKTMLRLNTPVLGKRLKGGLHELQRAVAVGDYVINADDTLSCQGVRLNPGEYFLHRDAVDSSSPVAAEGTLVVLLDCARGKALVLEGDARDLNRTIQDLRKRAGLAYADRIVLSIAGSGLDPLLAEFGPWLKEQALAAELTTQLAEPQARATASLSTGEAHVAIRRVGPVNALLGIGKRNKKLNAAAIKVATAIGPIHFSDGDKKCEPMDVLKHLTSDYLRDKLGR